MTFHWPGNRFGRYELQPASEKDRALLASWIAADSDHCETTRPEFFYDKQPNVECFRMVDNQGTVMFVKISRTLRIDIQFGPSFTIEERDRNGEALRFGFQWLAEKAREAGFRQLIFSTKDRVLSYFCKRRFCFIGSPNELVYTIGPRITHETQEKSAAHV